MSNLIYPVFILFFCLTLYSQTKNRISEIRTGNYKENVIVQDNELNSWESLRVKALKYSNERDYKQAEILAQRAKTLAENLKDFILVGRSYHLLGQVQPQIPQSSQTAASYYEKALNTFTKVEKTIETRKWVGYITNDLAFLNLNPDYIHSEKERSNAAYLLLQVYQMIRKYPSADLLDLEIKTTINISNYFLITGHIAAQMVWLEQAEQLSNANEKDENHVNNLHEIYIRQQRSLRRLGEYEMAFQSLENLNLLLKKYPSERRKLDYLRQLEDSYADVGKIKPMFATLDEAIALAAKIRYREGEFIITKILRLLQEQQVSEAKNLFSRLAANRRAGIEKIDRAVINAVIAAYENNIELSDSHFESAEKILREDLHSDWFNTLFLLNHESRVALHLKRFEKLKSISNKYLESAAQNKNKDSLPYIYLNLALGEFGLGNLAKAEENNREAVRLIEEKRKTGAAPISTGVMEVLYQAYEFQIKLNLVLKRDPEAFQASERMKSRWLNDKITNNRFNRTKIIDESSKKTILNISLEVLTKPDDVKINEQLSIVEKRAVFYANKSAYVFSEEEHMITELESSSIYDKTAVISYAFTSDGLNAFVYTKGKPIESIKINLSLPAADKLAAEVQKQIKNGIYYKENGRKLFDLLLKPLKILGRFSHLIIIPDKSLWKIPFQALSSDAKTFLIESVSVSYAPSVSILLNQLRRPKPARKSFQAFSSARFNNFLLQFADREARTLAEFYGTLPILDSTTDQFTSRAERSDILHFSMHAEVDREEPFNSFLAFSRDSKNRTGKLTVNDLLGLKLKDQSLVFLASCATDNVFNAEGLVSLAWGMMAAGATTVISAQWEANDESTEQFTTRFYKNYREGLTAAGALQKASIEMIRSRDGRLNKPYFWAGFTLNGDFR